MGTKSYLGERKTTMIPNKQILRFQCCDCGLVHDIDIKADSDEPITVTMTRNNRATGQIRRYRQISIVSK